MKSEDKQRFLTNPRLLEKTLKTCIEGLPISGAQDSRDRYKFVDEEFKKLGFTDYQITKGGLGNEQVCLTRVEDYRLRGHILREESDIFITSADPIYFAFPEFSYPGGKILEERPLMVNTSCFACDRNMFGIKELEKLTHLIDFNGTNVFYLNNLGDTCHRDYFNEFRELLFDAGINEIIPSYYEAAERLGQSN